MCLLARSDVYRGYDVTREALLTLSSRGRHALAFW